jgi:hypothetical protein
VKLLDRTRRLRFFLGYTSCLLASCGKYIGTSASAMASLNMETADSDAAARDVEVRCCVRVIHRSYATVVWQPLMHRQRMLQLLDKIQVP